MARHRRGLMSPGAPRAPQAPRRARALHRKRHENTIVFTLAEAVGHAGNVVAGDPVSALLIDAVIVPLRKMIGMLDIDIE